MIRLPRPNQDYIDIRPTPIALTLFVGLVYGLVSYLYMYRDYSRDDFLRLFVTPAAKTYRIYTGPKGGFYEQLGGLLAQRGDADLRLEAKKSGGSSQNVQSVSLDGDGFAFADESALDFKRGVAEKVQVVAPLFQEKLQIFYRRDKWRELPCARNSEEAEGPSLGVETSDCTRRFLHDATVHAGSSGTKTITAALLDLVEVQPKRRIAGDYDHQSEALRTGDATVGFAFMAPRLELATALDSGTLALMPVQPSIAPALRREQGLTFEPTQLSEFKTGPATLGQMAWLIAAQDIPKQDIARVLEKLNGVLTEQGMLGHAPDNDVLLSTAKQLRSETREHRRELWLTFSKFLLAILGVMVLTYRALGWLWSGALNFLHSRKYQELRSEFEELKGPDSANLSVASQLERMAAVRREIRRELSVLDNKYRRGELSTRHRDGLSSTLERLEQVLDSRFRVLFLDLIRDPYHPQLEQAVRNYAREGDIDLTLYERAVQVWEDARSRYYSFEGSGRLTWSSTPPGSMRRADRPEPHVDGG
jgi:hypothetical protein